VQRPPRNTTSLLESGKLEVSEESIQWRANHNYKYHKKITKKTCGTMRNACVAQPTKATSPAVVQYSRNVRRETRDPHIAQNKSRNQVNCNCMMIVEAVIWSWSAGAFKNSNKRAPVCVCVCVCVCMCVCVYWTIGHYSLSMQAHHAFLTARKSSEYRGHLHPNCCGEDREP
jgi:hypothetical protein